MNTWKTKPAILAALAAAYTVLIPITTSATAGDSNEWRFNVLLDGKPIGYHRFALNASGTQRELRSEARFNVKFLFINAYSYAHTAEERWQGECVSTLDARTDDNGEKIRVTGTRGDKQFMVATDAATDAATAALASCVQTFAYWNPTILNATQLLNPQTGEFVPVRVTRIGIDTVQVRGRAVPAERYRLVSEATAIAPLQIDLWYSLDRNPQSKQWLALESLAEGGRVLRYQIQ